jgi:hypothetical protein
MRSKPVAVISCQTDRTRTNSPSLRQGEGWWTLADSNRRACFGAVSRRSKSPGFRLYGQIWLRGLPGCPFFGKSKTPAKCYFAGAGYLSEMQVTSQICRFNYLQPTACLTSQARCGRVGSGQSIWQNCPQRGGARIDSSISPIDEETVD